MVLVELSPVLITKVGCDLNYINMPIALGLEMGAVAPAGFKCMGLL